MNVRRHLKCDLMVRILGLGFLFTSDYNKNDLLSERHLVNELKHSWGKE